MKRKAFTLIELLVVIAIIALLLSVLLPALNMAKERAKDLLCRTNIKSMQLATILYTDANEGKMPNYNYASGLWVNKITVYLDDIDKARYCPSTKRRKVLTYGFGFNKRTWVWDWTGMATPEEGSYTINWWFYTGIGSTDPRYFKTMSEVKAPHRSPVFADAIWVDAAPQDTDFVPPEFDISKGENGLGGGMSRLLTDRHGSHTNVGFADGHQQVVELGAMWSLKWNNEFQTTGWMNRTDGTPIYQK
jgi:prepilin-type N-terminal cleavage/methylation domain-containing protein/prepilin-type processing-associated H-X9-DG protein